MPACATCGAPIPPEGGPSPPPPPTPPSPPGGGPTHDEGCGPARGFSNTLCCTHLVHAAHMIYTPNDASVAAPHPAHAGWVDGTSGNVVPRLAELAFETCALQHRSFVFNGQGVVFGRLSLATVILKTVLGTSSSSAVSLAELPLPLQAALFQMLGPRPSFAEAIDRNGGPCKRQADREAFLLPWP